MAGIIEKIGQYFAHLELEQQRAVAQAATQSPAPPYGSAASHKTGRAPRRASSLRDVNEGDTRRSPSVVRRRLSLRSTEHMSIHQSTSNAPAVEQVVPPLARPLRSHWGEASSVGDDIGESLASWRSLTSQTSDAGGRTVVEDGSSGRRSLHATPRKKRIKKRKPPSPATLELHAAEREQERSERVAKGFALAQERARRIEEDAQQQARAKRQARQDAVNRIKVQLERIEDIRAQRATLASSSMALSTSVPATSSCRSLTSRESSSASLTPSSRPEALTVNSSVASIEDTAESHPLHLTDATTAQKTVFLAELENRTRTQMLLQLEFRKQCLGASKCRERLQQQMSRTLQANVSKQARISSLEQSKHTAEKQLAGVLNELSTLRRQRHEMEETGRNERLRRQQEAEKALQRRLREEEWAKLMDEEKARTVIAAEARDKAGERVQKARWASKPRDRSTPHRQHKPDSFIASLGPELAEFEEEGLCPSDICMVMQPANSNQEEAQQRFEWLVPRFDDHTNEFNALLRSEMLSDDEDE